MGREEGLAEDDVLALSNYQESDAFSDVEKLVLDYALCLCETPVDVPDALFEALRAEFNEAELIEITATAAFENYLARFNRGFNVEAQGFSSGSVCPIPDHHAARMLRSADAKSASD